MDQFSKLTKFYMMRNQKLDSLTEVLQDRYFPELGIPDEILTDNEGQFITDRWKHFGEERGIKMRHTSSYNPQSNPVERVMRELGRIIRAYAHKRQTVWARIIPRAERIINITTHRSTGQKPVEQHTGLH